MIESVNEPDPKKRVNPVAKEAIADFLKDADWAAKPKDDITILFESFEHKTSEVIQSSKELIDNAITWSTLHSPEGRRDFVLAMHRKYVEQYGSYNREELLFLLAWVEANLLGERIA